MWKRQTCVLIHSKHQWRVSEPSPLLPRWRASFYSECCHQNKTLPFFPSFQDVIKINSDANFVLSSVQKVKFVSDIQQLKAVCTCLLQRFIKLISFFTVFYIKYIQTLTRWSFSMYNLILIFILFTFTQEQKYFYSSKDSENLDLHIKREYFSAFPQ